MILTGLLAILGIAGVWIALCKLLWDEKNKDKKAEQKIRQKYLNSDYYKSTKLPIEKVFADKGLYGEYCLELICEHIPMKHRMLFNLIVPQEDGHFQEIDALCIMENGEAIILEGKNRPGFFCGMEQNYVTDKQWKQVLGQNEHEMYSPVLQNKYHGLALSKWLCDHNYFDEYQGFKGFYKMVIFVDNDAWFGFESNPFAEAEARGIFVGNAQAAIEVLGGLKNGGNVNPDFMEEFYEYLYPFTQISDVETLMEQREEQSKVKKSKRYSKPKYFYIDCFPETLFRYDGEYVEYSSREMNAWALFYDFEKFTFDRSNKVWHAVPNLKSKIEYLEGHDLTAYEMSPEEVCNFFTEYDSCIA